MFVYLIYKDVEIVYEFRYNTVLYLLQSLEYLIKIIVVGIKYLNIT